MLVIVTATDWEMNVISRNIRDFEGFQESGLRMLKGNYRGKKKLLLVRTGVGKLCAERAAKYLSSTYRIESLVSFGMAGGLSQELEPGDVVICGALRCLDTELRNNICEIDSSLIDRACLGLSNCELTWRRGTGVTILEAATGISEKHNLKSSTESDICEMEDYWIARVAAAHDIPFLSVRVVFDEVGYSLPSLNSIMDANGNVKTAWATAYFLTHPAFLLKMPGLYRRSRAAGKGLSLAAKRILDGLTGEAA